MEIKTVTAYRSEDFDKEVNALLRQGWKLHGTPNFTSVGTQDTWDGRLRSHVTNTYTQCLIRE